ncbi:MAG: serpin family protein, partial [Planctomycetota bacterium]
MSDRDDRQFEDELRRLEPAPLRSEAVSRFDDTLADARRERGRSRRVWFQLAAVAALGLGIWWIQDVDSVEEGDFTRRAFSTAWAMTLSEGARYRALGEEELELISGEVRLAGALGGPELLIRTPAGTVRLGAASDAVVSVESTVPTKNERDPKVDMTKTHAFLIAGSLFFSNAHGDVRAAPSELISATAAEAAKKQIARANNQFGFELYRQLTLDLKPGENFVYSPYGLSVCLSLLSEGARGQTALELRRALGLPTGDQLSKALAEQNAGHRALQEALEQKDTPELRGKRERVIALRRELETVSANVKRELDRDRDAFVTWRTKEEKLVA